MAPSVVDELLARGPSITDDDEEETKVEPADAAIKAAASVEDVCTALSAQASVEREKALRRIVAADADEAPTSADLEFEDPNGRQQRRRRGRGAERQRRRRDRRR